MKSMAPTSAAMAASSVGAEPEKTRKRLSPRSEGESASKTRSPRSAGMDRSTNTTSGRSRRRRNGSWKGEVVPTTPIPSSFRAIVRPSTMASSSSSISTLVMLRLHGRRERVARDRFHQVMVDSVLEPGLVPVADVFIDGRDHDDPRRVGRFRGADEAADLEPVHVRQETIDNNGARFHDGRDADGLEARSPFDGLITTLFHLIDDCLPREFVVIDDEHEPRGVLTAYFGKAC